MKLKIILRYLLVCLLVILSGFTIWAYTPPPATGQAIQALKSDSVVNVVQEKNWVKIFSQ